MVAEVVGGWGRGRGSERVVVLGMVLVLGVWLVGADEAGRRGRGSLLLLSNDTSAEV